MAVMAVLDPETTLSETPAPRKRGRPKKTAATSPDKQGWGLSTAPEIIPPAEEVLDEEMVEMVPVDEAMTSTKHFRVGETSLLAVGRPSFEEWAQVGRRLRMFEHGIAWLLGDWLNLGESIFGEKASQEIDAGNLSESTCRVYRWVAAQIPAENRRTALSFAHHQNVAQLSPSEQTLWLDRAEEGTDGRAWSSALLKSHVQAAKGGAVPAAAPVYEMVVVCSGEEDLVALGRQLENLGRTNYRTKIGRG